MTTGRMEAFSDGVLAIVITIMVLEMKVPHGSDWTAVRPLIPVFLSYLLSFIFIGIYWNNHHHLLQVASTVNGSVLWANLHLLFWLSLIPFVTGWMGENEFAPLPVALYGVVLLLAACAYWILSKALIAHHDKDSALARAIGQNRKANVSLALYVLAVALAWVHSGIALAIYVLVAILWLIPGRSFEQTMREDG